MSFYYYKLQEYADKNNPLYHQEGGSHYKNKEIQPVEFIYRNNLGFLEGCVVKRMARWRDKNGIEDLKKAIHEIELLIEMEELYGRERSSSKGNEELSDHGSSGC